MHVAPDQVVPTVLSIRELLDHVLAFVAGCTTGLIGLHHILRNTTWSRDSGFLSTRMWHREARPGSNCALAEPWTGLR